MMQKASVDAVSRLGICSKKCATLEQQFAVFSISQLSSKQHNRYRALPLFNL
jgi:hypothetical protein